MDDFLPAIPILFGDETIVVIDKPSGIVVNRAEQLKEVTVQDWMEERVEFAPMIAGETDDQKYFRERSGLVHRLDRETSGVMVLAKNAEAFSELLRQFKEREIKKEYLALTHGIWKEKYGEISATVGRMRHNRKMMGVREDGKESTTGYRVEKEFLSWNFGKELDVDDRGYTGFSLVRFIPRTGRTHQIRVHARHLGHPLVGDFVYAGRKRSREDRKWAGRIMLQAQRLEFTHPGTGKSMVFESKGSELENIMHFFHATVV